MGNLDITSYGSPQSFKNYQSTRNDQEQLSKDGAELFLRRKLTTNNDAMRPSIPSKSSTVNTSKKAASIPALHDFVEVIQEAPYNSAKHTVTLKPDLSR